jgi:O-antigen/teichoic acid export membrane protein
VVAGAAEWRHVFSAGFKLSSSTFLYDIGQGGPELICGRTLGFEAVAFFSRGFGAASMLLRALVDGIVPVANAYYAKKAREDASIREPYLTAISYLAVVALPAFAMLVLLAKPLILVLYGVQWSPRRRPCRSWQSVSAASRWPTSPARCWSGPGRSAPTYA